MRQDTFEPVALCRDYLNLVLWLWNHAEKQTYETVAASLNRLRADEKAKERAEEQLHSEETRNEVLKQFRRRRGLVDPPVFIDLGRKSHGMDN